MRPRASFALLVAGLPAAPLAAQVRVPVVIEAADRARSEVPVALELRRGADLPADLELGRPLRATVAEGGALRAAQAEPLRDDAGEAVGLIVRWLEPALPADAAARRTLTLEPAQTSAPRADFHFRRDAAGLDLFHGERLVWRHAREFDPERFEETYKPYHQLADLHGATLLTKGPGGTHPHHRGLFLGWGTTRVGAAPHDFWYTPTGGRQRQLWQGDDEAREQAGAVFARSVSRTRWITGADEAVVEDERDLVTWALGDGWLVDATIRLRALVDGVVLDGDAAHAGFQVRLAQTVADGASCTFVRPPQAVDEGNDTWSSCPWVAARFPIGDRRYELLFLDHPDDPRPTAFNTRAYGRFGAFFRAKLEPESPLVLRYRLRVRELEEGREPAVDELDAAWRNFADPPRARRE